MRRDSFSIRGLVDSLKKDSANDLPDGGTCIVLYEFALTQDVFDADMIEDDPVHGVTLVQVLRGMCDNGMIANLHRDKWIKHLQEERIPYLSPSLKDKILVCLTTLNDRHRLVRHPLRVAGDPSTD